MVLNAPLTRYDLLGLYGGPWPPIDHAAIAEEQRLKAVKEANQAAQRIFNKLNLENANANRTCNITLCEAIGMFIDAVAAESEDFDQFTDKIYEHGWASGAKEHDKNMGVQARYIFEAWYRRSFGSDAKTDFCCSGFNASSRANAYDNLSHFSAIMEGGIIAYKYLLRSDQKQLKDALKSTDPVERSRIGERQAEVFVDGQVYAAYNSIWSVLDEAEDGSLIIADNSNKAWKLHSDLPGKEWRARLCEN